MLILHTKLAQADAIDGELELRYEQRERCRLRVALATGEEAAVFMARGSVLRDGDLLSGEDGRVIRVLAAREPVYLVSCPAFEPEAGAYGGAGHSHGQDQLLAPVPLRQKIHRPGDPASA